MSYRQLFIIVFAVLFSFSSWTWAANSTQTEAAIKYINKATDYFNSKQYIRAEKYFRKVLATNVKVNQDFNYFFAEVLARNEKYEESLEYIAKYVGQANKHDKYYDAALLVQENVLRKIKAKKLAKKNKAQQFENVLKPKMIEIQPKRFLMGTTTGEDDHKPPHRFTIKRAYAIGQYEITFKQYDYFAKQTKRELPDDEGFGRGTRPVINVNIQDALAYCDWLGEKDGSNYRLPTEAEWEYASKAVKKKTLGFKDLIGIGDANCDDCKFFWQDDKTQPVGSYEANALGLYDIFGNVWEWTCSEYTPQGYVSAALEKQCVPRSQLGGKTLVVRGGSWRSSKQILRPYIRYNNFPSYRADDLGFRIVQELD